MFVARFKFEKREPQKIYFSAQDRDTKKLEFGATKKEPIKFKVSRFKMNVEN